MAICRCFAGSNLPPVGGCPPVAKTRSYRSRTACPAAASGLAAPGGLSRRGHSHWASPVLTVEAGEDHTRIEAGYVVAGRYERAWRIGRGSTGEVGVAHHKTLGQDIAIKLQPVRGAGECVEEHATAASRFHFEARIAAHLCRRTRHVVGVIDHGEDDGLAFQVMELLEGETLEAELARGARRAPGDTTKLISQIARALTGK
jgi:hypothetical protein